MIELYHSVNSVIPYILRLDLLRLYPWPKVSALLS